MLNAQTRIQSLHSLRIELFFIAADVFDLVCRSTTFIEPQINPFLHKLLCKLKSNDALSEAQHLRVIREDGSLNTVWVMGCHGSDTGDLVR